MVSRNINIITRISIVFMANDKTPQQLKIQRQFIVLIHTYECINIHIRSKKQMNLEDNK